MAGLALPLQCRACHQVVIERAQLLQKNTHRACESYSVSFHISLICLMRYYYPGAVIVIKRCLQKEGDSQRKGEPT